MYTKFVLYKQQQTIYQTDFTVNHLKFTNFRIKIEISDPTYR